MNDGFITKKQFLEKIVKRFEEFPDDRIVESYSCFALLKNPDGTATVQVKSGGCAYQALGVLERVKVEILEELRS